MTKEEIKAESNLRLIVLGIFTIGFISFTLVNKLRK